MKLELSFIQNTQQRNAWPQRGRESTLTPIHRCHRPSIPFWHVLIERRCFIKHCKEQWVNKKKEKTNPPPQTTQKGIGSKTHKQKQQHVWELWTDETRVVVHPKYTTAESVATEIVRESTCTHLLLCIIVTAPVFHLDTSELNLDAPLNTAREGATKKRPTHHKPQKRVPF